MEPTGCPEMFVRNYSYSLCSKSEEHSSQRTCALASPYFCCPLHRWEEWGTCVPGSEGASQCGGCARAVPVPAGRFNQSILLCYWHTKANICVAEGWPCLETGIMNFGIPNGINHFEYEWDVRSLTS